MSEINATADEWRPSFTQKRDLRRFILAVLGPWLLMGLAYATPSLFVKLCRMGLQIDVAVAVFKILFYLTAYSAILLALSMFILGPLRLFWFPAYRKSAYGWVWFGMTLLNVGIWLAAAYFGKHLA